jgi:hypothetical protein
VPKPYESVKEAPQKAVPKGTSTTAIRTKRIASRRVIALRGDLIRMRIPAAAETHFTASKASQVNAYNGGQCACWVARKCALAAART